jgi:uncharacterized protein involved in exopolysaccharide biosynthesis
MSQRALDVFFRHKVLTLLPLVVLVIVGAAAAYNARPDPTYRASATIWTRQSTLLDSGLGIDSNPYLTAAENQGQVFTDLLRLDSFALTVAARVDGLKGLPPKAQIYAVRSNTVVVPEGVNVLTIYHDDRNPVLARDIVQAILDSQGETITTDVVAESDAAIEFYEARLELAKEELDKETASLVKYQASIPQSLLEDPNYVDPVLAERTASAQRARDDYNLLLDQLEGIHLERDAALEGRDLSFQVADPPELPVAARPTGIKSMLAFPILGLLLGISASGIMLFALTRLDEGIRLPSEAERVGPVLAVVPDLGQRKRRGWPKNFVRQVVFASRGLLGNMS